MTPSDLAALHRGDPAFFRSLVARWSDRLLRFARTMTPDWDVAHDVVQETWICAYERRRQFRGTGSFVGWLVAICRSTALRRARRDAVRRRSLAGVPGAAPAAPPSPEAGAEAEALKGSVLNAVEELPERQRQTVYLRVLEGRSTAEAARIMGCAEGTVKAALHAAIKNLAPKLQDWLP